MRAFNISRRNPYDTEKALLRMSWDPKNLYNIWQRNIGPLKGQLSFSKTKDTIFQNQFFSKRHLRNYWGPHVTDRNFRKWYLPANLPIIVPTAASSPTINPTSKSITRYSHPGKEGGRRTIESEEMYRYHGAQAPIGPFMFREIERRLDTVLFRGGFAKNLHVAKRMITGGKVRLNGKTEVQPQIRLLPGDFLEVNPDAIAFLNRPSAKEVALAQESSKGMRYNIKDGYRVLLRDVVGLRSRDIERLVRRQWKGTELDPEKSAAAARTETAEVEEATVEEIKEEDPEEEEFDEESLFDTEPVTSKKAVEVKDEAASSASSATPVPSSSPSSPTPRASPPARSPTLELMTPIPASIPRSPPAEPIALTPSHFPALPTDPAGARDFHLPAYSSPHLFVPAYLQPNYQYCTLAYLRHPTARHNYCEIPSPYDAKGDVMSAAWEWYGNRRIRTKVYTGGLYPGGIDARARIKGRQRGPEVRRTGVHEDYY